PSLQPSSCRPCWNAAKRACHSGSFAVEAISTPMRRTRSLCCARAASGHVAAAPRIVMNSRRLIAAPEVREHRSNACVSSERGKRMPRMSALGQKQTYAVQKGMSALPPKATLDAEPGISCEPLPAGHGTRGLPSRHHHRTGDAPVAVRVPQTNAIRAWSCEFLMTALDSNRGRKGRETQIEWSELRLHAPF